MRKVFALILALAACAAAEPSREAERDLEAARNKEVVQGDVPGAIKLYQRILSRHGSHREVAATALFHLAQCHEKIGEAEARKSYERLVKEFSDQKELASRARARLAALNGDPVEKATPARLVIGESEYCSSANPNGQWAACVVKGEVHLRNLVTGKETRVEHGDGKKSHAGAWPVIAPDGKWVAYERRLSYPSDPSTLWLSASDGSSQKKLESPDGARRFQPLVFSSDSRLLLVFFEMQGQREGELRLYAIPGGEGRLLHRAADFRWAGKAVFSPDGKYIVMLTGRWTSVETQVAVFPVAGGQPWHLPLESGETPSGFMPDGRLVFHSPNRGGTSSLWTLPLRNGQAAGSPEVLVREASKLPGRYYSNGKYFYPLKKHRYELLSVRMEDTSATPRPAITRDQGQGVAPAFSRDGKFLAYGKLDQTSGQVVVRDLETGNETVHHSSLTWTDQVRWYPGNQALLVFGERQEKFVCVKLDLTTGEVTNVLTEMGRTDASTNPQISPDGKYLYYKRFIDFDKLGYEGMRIHRLDLVTGADKEAYRPPAGEMVRLFAISPDGSRIAVGGRGPKGDWVGTAVVGGAETEIVYQYPEKMIQRAFNGIAWAADGKAVFHTFLTGEQRGDTLGLQSLDGSPPRKLLDAGILFNIAAHPNGRELILDSRTYGWELWVMEGIR